MLCRVVEIVSLAFVGVVAIVDSYEVGCSCAIASCTVEKCNEIYCKSWNYDPSWIAVLGFDPKTAYSDDVRSDAGPNDGQPTKHGFLKTTAYTNCDFSCGCTSPVLNKIYSGNCTGLCMEAPQELRAFCADERTGELEGVPGSWHEGLGDYDD